MAPEAGGGGPRGAESEGDDGREAPAGAGGAAEDTTGLPPFLSSWRAFYILVIANLALLILVFLCIQAYFA